jgi:hypothetical protein
MGVDHQQSTSIIQVPKATHFGNTCPVSGSTMEHQADPCMVGHIQCVLRIKHHCPDTLEDCVQKFESHKQTILSRIARQFQNFSNHHHSNSFEAQEYFSKGPAILRLRGFGPLDLDIEIVTLQLINLSL